MLEHGRRDRLLVWDEMNVMMTICAASVTTFAVTNIDDIFLLTLFFARKVPARRIVAGQYLGFSLIILLSCVGALLALAIPVRWNRVLGLLPLALGVKELAQLRRSKQAHELSGERQSLTTITAITVSNGADNVGVYIPFFRFNSHHLWQILAVYGMLVGVWCIAARLLGGHPVAVRALDRAGHWLVPFVFITLGFYILAF